MFVYLCVCLQSLLACEWWVRDTDGGHQQAGWRQISYLLISEQPSPLPLPLSPRGAPVCNTTRFGKPHVLMEANHGLSRLIPPPVSLAGSGLRAREGGGVCVWMSAWTALFWKSSGVVFTGKGFPIRTHLTPINKELYENACLPARF